MWAFSQATTEQTSATTDYRYIGASPNNYITFNNETWRIIGIFDGRIKIIRNASLGSMPWDWKKKNVGTSTSDYGSGNWTDAQVMYMINNNFLATDSTILKSGYTFDGTYVKDGNSSIMYQKGCNSASIAKNDSSYSCTAQSWTLNSTAVNQIDKVTYYLAGINADSINGKGATSWYSIERGTTVYSGRPTSWSGYVGLMYASDYGYTFANDVNSVCYNNLYNCSGGSPSSSWLYNSDHQWFIVPHSGWVAYAYYVNSNGNIRTDYDLHNSLGVRPVVYLKSSVQLNGTGTSGDPYTIVG